MPFGLARAPGVLLRAEVMLVLGKIGGSFEIGPCGYPNSSTMLCSCLADRFINPLVTGASSAALMSLGGQGREAAVR